MKALLYAGHELITTDEVAAALVEYLTRLPLNHPPHRVAIPVIRGEMRSSAELVMTGRTSLAVIATDAADERLDGDDYAVNVLQQRADSLAGIGAEPI